MEAKKVEVNYSKPIKQSYSSDIKDSRQEELKDLLYEFFDDIMIKYLDNENKTLNTNNKQRFKRTSKNIALHIFEQKINMDKLYKYCCKFFSINEEV